jgi:hypothetical protein
MMLFPQFAHKSKAEQGSLIAILVPPAGLVAGAFA